MRNPSDRAGISRWRQIGETLANEIEQGVLAPEKRLPRSEDLAQRFGVNRHTVLRALSHLRAEGLIRVERGRGAYAVVNPLQYRLGPRRWFELNLLESNLTPSRTLISVLEIAATEKVAKGLQIALGAPVTFVTLLGEADGFPINFGYHYFPAERLPGVADAFRAFGSLPSQSLSFTRIFNACGVHEFRRHGIRIRSRPPTIEEAHYLKMAPNDHVLETEIANVDGAMTPVVYALNCFCSSRVELALEPGDLKS